MTESINNQLDRIASAIKAQLQSMNLSIYTFCRLNLINETSVRRLLSGDKSYNISSLLEILDLLNLEIKIVDKE